MFFLMNQNQFARSEFLDIILSFLIGIRFDLTTITWSNSLFILLSIIPLQVFYEKWYQTLLKSIFILTNSIFLLFNCIDIAYFGYTNKRSNSDIFNQIFGGQTDVLKQIPDYLSDFWPVILFYIFLLFFMIRFWSKIKSEHYLNRHVYSVRNLISSSFIFLFTTGATLLSARGGWQYIPLQIVDAGTSIPPKLIPVVLNTPFTIIRSMEASQLEELNFVSNNEAKKFISPEKHFKGKTFLKKNVVILILEGFSKEYTGISGRKSLTPFLDSLMNQSLVFTNSWANGKQSIEGVPAIISGIPSFMNNPYINSGYAANRLNSFPQQLKKKGYTTAFFHGGKNGTMNFDAYAKTAGFDLYFGMNEYPNKSEFDGNWGIWDEEYLQYCAKEFSKLKVPFFTSIFTLSSHHPFNVPERYRNKFPHNGLECSPTIGYTDFALRKFFEVSKKEKWFNETWFVIVPDHTGISADPFYANSVGQHTIPIIIYSPEKNFLGQNNTIIQQIDIFPSLMDTLGYNEPFFSFGKSVFQKEKNEFAIFCENGNYFLINDSNSFIFNNHKITQVFNFGKDSTLSRDVKKEYLKQILNAEKYYKNFFQLYHHTLNSNTAYIE
jgi:phosphoglycerol transferase MdoB-like AlkP superfamily enzyme